MLRHRARITSVFFALVAGTGGVARGAAPATTAGWTFDTDGDLEGWAPNAQVIGATVAGGALRARTDGLDPFFALRDVEIAATPTQYLVLHLRASRGGMAELFWTGTTEGPYEGFSEAKKTRFLIPDLPDDDQTLALFPFWHAEGTIRRLRLDLYDDATFVIDAIELADWGAGQPPARDVYEWRFDESDTAPWQIRPGLQERFAPPLELDTQGREYIALTLTANQDCTAELIWAWSGIAGAQTLRFDIHRASQPRARNIRFPRPPAPETRLVALGLRLPAEADVRLASALLCTGPQGPPAPVVTYLGFETGVNRAGHPAHILLQVGNQGGVAASRARVAFAFPTGLTPVGSIPDTLALPEFGEDAQLALEVTAPGAGTHAVVVAIGGPGMSPTSARTELHFLPPVPASKTDYVPEPRPVPTTIPLLAYYFPGWPTPAKWAPVRQGYPARRPILGYYDEGNPECVDWQIKWARENGISGFLVDWYWNAGTRQLTHWFEAYRRARYRDQLAVAIMWANHNPPGSHSRADWRAVVQHWIEHYFNLPAYLQIAGKPALFIWDPSLLRIDLGGSEQVADALAEAQDLARAAGLPGITFACVNRCDSPADARALAAEGYTIATNYHEWGRAMDLGPVPGQMRYEDVVQTAPETWARRRQMCAPLEYCPVVDTGWDSRPWHGDKAMVISGRTPALFRDLLAGAREFCKDARPAFVILGPVNEWGEGSYIEPCTEFGFAMLEAVRSVFAATAPDTWPVNLAPADVGRGPYDLPPPAAIP